MGYTHDRNNATTLPDDDRVVNPGTDAGEESTDDVNLDEEPSHVHIQRLPAE